MTVASPSDSTARAVQKDIDKIQEELHSSACKVIAESNMKKNKYFSTRNAVISKAIENGQLPRTFWADAIISVLSTFIVDNGEEEEEDTDEDEMNGNSLLGPFDIALLKNYLKDMHVEYTTRGTKMIWNFKTNPYFEETTLWAEMLQEISNEKNEKSKKEEEEDDDVATVDGCRFSDITWKPGHGPQEEEDEDDDDEKDKNENNKNVKKTGKDSAAVHSGAKRALENNKRDKKDEKEIPTRGWSVLEKFSAMPPHPEEEEDEEEDEEDDEEDEDELAMAAQEWEAEIEERKDFLQILVDAVWANPTEGIIAYETAEKLKKESKEGGEPAKQRVRAQ